MSIPARQQLNGRLAGLRTDRYSWWVTWREISTFELPYRYRWLVTTNEMNRGQIRTGAIIDSTGTIAARVLAAGMMSGITSPARPWFKLRMEGFEKDQVNPVNLWLAECERRMMRVFQESNFYNCIAVVFLDLSTFGTGPMLIHEDYENVINCSNPCAGEYYLGLGAKLRVEIFYREIIKTVWSLVDEFGLENVSQTVKTSYEQGGASLTLEVKIAHAIEPNAGDGFKVNKSFAYREIYWEVDSADTTKFLCERGYYEKPGIFPRWDVSGNDAYGVGPGWYALGDIKQLQQEQKRKAQAIDKLANPPMVADVELKNQPASTLPGGVTYITKKEGVGFKPAYENFRPPIQELMLDIEQVQDRIKRVFFNDLFLMFQDMQAEPRMQGAVDARREEKLVMLGPVLERFQTEALDPAIDRTFGIMQRGGLLPPPPPEIQGKPIQVEYVSILATAQNAAATVGIERLLGLIGSLVGVDRTVMDNVNLDRIIIKYGADLTVPPDLFNTEDEKTAIRQGRQEQEKQAQAVALADAAAKGAKTLSETDVGSGQNALQAMTGMGGMQ